MQNNTLKKSFHQNKKAKKEYFITSEKEIDQKNQNILLNTMIITTVLSIAFTLVAQFMIHTWHPTIHYYILICLEIPLLIYAFIINRKPVENHMLIQASCIFVMYFIFAGCAVVDIFPNTSGRAVFIPLLLAIAPALFIFEPKIIYSIVFISDLCFVIVDLNVKQGTIGQIDVFASIVGMLFGLCLYNITLKLRVEDHNIRMQYVGLSKIDGLTSVMNHEASVWEMEHYLSEKNSVEPMVLLIIDIDDFKMVNDRFGHDQGDMVLKSFSNILKSMFRQSDIVGRFGGDEFIVCIKGIEDEEKVEEKCAAINEMCSHIMGEKNRISCSIGGAISHGGIVSFQQMFKVADDNLYEAKAFGKSRSVLSEVRESVIDTSPKPVMLVVDDNEVDRGVIAAEFSEQFEVIEMSKGMDALDYLNQSKNKVAVILLDIMMPEMDGFEVITHLKNRFATAKIPIVVISADASNEKKALECGACEMLIKPFSPEVVKLRVDNVMKNKNVF